MKESYYGRIQNSGAQYVKAVCEKSKTAAPKEAAYAGNGVKSGYHTRKNKKQK